LKRPQDVTTIDDRGYVQYKRDALATHRPCNACLLEAIPLPQSTWVAASVDVVAYL
jgi:hypothetical protein